MGVQEFYTKPTHTAKAQKNIHVTNILNSSVHI